MSELVVTGWCLAGFLSWLFYGMREGVFQDEGFFGCAGYVGFMLPLSVALGPFAWPMHWLGTRE